MEAINQKKWLYGMTLPELNKLVVSLGAKPFVARQIAGWLYNKEVREISQMTNLSQSFRDVLCVDYEVGSIIFSSVDSSVDGTRKYLFPTLNGGAIESAYIPDKERATLCVSSQVGCKMMCSFCMTGRQGFKGNLSTGEILNQIRNIEESDKLTNVVYMGMGEPLDNVDNVLKSIEILTAPWGYAWSPTRITLSTIGVIPALHRYLDESKAHLTISLHGSSAQKRGEIMPIENKYSIEEVIDLVSGYDFTHQRRISFGYIMFSGLNDSAADAERICNLLRGINHCRVNLIPFHEIPDSELRPSSRERMEDFRDYLTRKGVITTIRSSRGQDIDAACGLLSTKQEMNK
ncbi:MAG: 23S rRNA (adenine(2503)-C(2))-methyltransferase RlmN [Rikenellaceae bacterium]